MAPSVQAADYSSPATVRYEYYNWYDNPISYQILEDNGGSIISVTQEVGEWAYYGSVPWSGIQYENHIFRHRLVVVVQNNRVVTDYWPYTNTHYGFRIRIWDSVRLNYIDDIRDPLYDYSPGHHWYPSSVDGHFIPISTSFIDLDYDYPNGNWEREYFRIGINWRCACDKVTSISGYKFNDLNKNGVWDGGEPALQGWTINLAPCFIDNFEDENADGWTPLAGTWAVVNDSGNYVYSGTATADEQVSYASAFGTFDNFTVEAKTKAINSDGHYGIVLREDGTGKHYGLYLHAVAEGQYYFGYWDGSSYHDLVPWTSTTAYSDAHVWNKLKVVAEGNVFELYINDVLVNTVTDTSSYASSGYVGFIVDKNIEGQNSYFDDITS